MSVRRILNLAWFVAAVAGGAILLSACGGGGGTSGANPKVNVTLREWSLTPDQTSVSAGNTTFTATNTGTVAHEFVVLKTDLAADALPLAGGAVDEDAAGDVIDEIAEFPAGTTQTLTLDLAPGAYVLFCNVAGHYEQGVRSAFSVTEVAAAGGRY